MVVGDPLAELFVLRQLQYLYLNLNVVEMTFFSFDSACH